MSDSDNLSIESIQQVVADIAALIEADEKQLRDFMVNPADWLNLRSLLLENGFLVIAIHEGVYYEATRMGPGQIPGDVYHYALSEYVPMGEIFGIPREHSFERFRRRYD